jgi:hypothetical protein
MVGEYLCRMWDVRFARYQPRMDLVVAGVDSSIGSNDSMYGRLHICLLGHNNG